MKTRIISGIVMVPLLLIIYFGGIQQLAARLAMNSPIQGSAADIIKVAMNKVDAELREQIGRASCR